LKNKNLNSAVFIIHRGNQKHLTSIILSAKLSSNKVYYIGDQNISNQLLSKNQIIRPDFNKIPFLDKFTKVWKHLMTNSMRSNFEFDCFTRHFFVLEAASRLKLSDFWIIDSDFMLLENLHDLGVTLKQKGFEGALSTSHCNNKYYMASAPHCSFWNIHSLREFILFTIDQYKNNSKMLMKKYLYHKNKKLEGGVCDMTLLYLWKNKTKRKIYNSVNLIKSKLLIDHNINFQSDFYALDDFSKGKNKSILKKKLHFVMEDFLGVKKIRKEKDSFYAIRADGFKTKVIGLHFQGAAKILIKRFMFFKSTHFIFFIDIILIKLLKRIIKNLLNILSTQKLEKLR
jgi:hypothetical protein